MSTIKACLRRKQQKHYRDYSPFPDGRAIAIGLSLILFLALPCAWGLAATPGAPQSAPGEQIIETAPVRIDGFTLFWVRGIKAYPAAERAETIAGRIKDVAADRSIRVDSIRAVEAEDRTNLMAGNIFVASVVDADAALEGVPRQQIASIYVQKVQAAVSEFRGARTSKNIVRGVLYAAGYTLILGFLFFLMVKLYRKLVAAMETRYAQKISALQAKAHDVIKTKEILVAAKGFLNTLRFILLSVIFYIYLERVLRLFPWTRFYADKLLDYLYDPLKIIGSGIFKVVPDLIFLAIWFFAVRLLLRFVHVFFRQIERGAHTIAGFHPEWANPTNRLLSYLIIAFALVVAFPYIPGSSSAAFKGISLFIGVLFSLGSQSAVSNTIAGFVVQYRRAFRLGDRIQVNDVTGDVAAIRMQVTAIRTIKNEEVIVPNSTILSSNVINYSLLAKEKGLILHTEVTIGYDAPWRQVHAMLLTAAQRTSGVLREPPPFVLQKSLDDFFVRYELNVYTDAPQTMANVYSDLHKNIQDCFNEYGVQIMSPHYLGDPAQMKVVPKEDWHKPPAGQREEGEHHG